VAEAETGRVLGIHALAANASDAILAGVFAVKFGLNVDDLADTWAPYLTMAEGIMLTAQSFSPILARGAGDRLDGAADCARRRW
jgi:mercuric reductase